jgi:tRNA pseudouridine55 synthase
MAEGVLLVLWEKATLLVPFLHEYPKEYRAVVRLGRTTDTQDRTGTVLAERSPSGITTATIEAALPRFRGRILQTPPSFSALKQKGRRAYEEARRGNPTPPEPRHRHVHRLELVEWNPPLAVLDCSVEGGTYIRTLAHDMGQALGVGGSLDELLRTAVGPFRFEDAEDAQSLFARDRGAILERAVPPADILPDWPRMVVPGEEGERVLQGSWLDPHRRLTPGTRYRLVDEQGGLLALVEGGEKPRYLRVVGDRKRSG